MLAAFLFDQEDRHDNFVERPDMMLVSVIAGLMDHFGKGYCFPSQQKIREMMKRKGRPMSVRASVRHLNALERDGWIKRKRRHTHDPQRGWTFRSTLYTLTRRALRWLADGKNAGNRAFAFLYPSRVPTSAQYSLPKRIIPGAHPKSGCAPPGFVSNVSADNPGGTEDKKKEVAFSYLRQIKDLLRG